MFDGGEHGFFGSKLATDITFATTPLGLQVLHRMAHGSSATASCLGELARSKVPLAKASRDLDIWMRAQ